MWKIHKEGNKSGSTHEFTIHKPCEEGNFENITQRQVTSTSLSGDRPPWKRKVVLLYPEGPAATGIIIFLSTLADILYISD